MQPSLWCCGDSREDKPRVWGATRQGGAGVRGARALGAERLVGAGAGDPLRRGQRPQRRRVGRSHGASWAEGAGAPRPCAGSTAAALRGEEAGVAGTGRRRGEARGSGPGHPREAGRSPVSCTDRGEGWRQEQGAGELGQEPWRLHSPPTLRSGCRATGPWAGGRGKQARSTVLLPEPGSASCCRSCPDPALARPRAFCSLCPEHPSLLPISLLKVCPHGPILWEEG